MVHHACLNVGQTAAITQGRKPASSTQNAPDVVLTNRVAVNPVCLVP